MRKKEYIILVIMHKNFIFRIALFKKLCFDAARNPIVCDITYALRWSVEALLCVYKISQIRDTNRLKFDGKVHMDSCTPL